MIKKNDYVANFGGKIRRKCGMSKLRLYPTGAEDAIYYAVSGDILYTHTRHHVILKRSKSRSYHFSTAILAATHHRINDETSLRSNSLAGEIVSRMAVPDAFVIF